MVITITFIIKIQIRVISSMSPETKKTVKAIRNELKKPRTKGIANGNNVLRLKKMIKLLNLYLKVIQESKSPDGNIEIVRFNCDKSKTK